MGALDALKARKGDWTRNTYLSPLDSLFIRATSFYGRTKSRRAELENRGTLTPKGVVDELLDLADREMTPELRRIRERVEQTRADIKLKRAGLGKPKIDPSDVAAAMLRQELRAHLRSLGGMAAAAVLQPDASPELIAAVLEAPPELSGITADVRTRVAERFVTSNHAAGLAEITEAEEGLDLLNAVLGVAEGDIERGVRG